MNRKTILAKILVLVVFVISFTSTFTIGYSYWDDSSKQDNVTASIGSWKNTISTAQEFYDMVTNTSSLSTDEFYLANDIDFTGFTWDYDATNYNVTFRGTLHGEGYTLSNLTINNDSSTYVYFGIFPRLESATIENLNLSNVNLVLGTSGLSSSSINSGLIAGEVYGNTTTIANITITDSGVRGTGSTGTGGLVGYLSASTTILDVDNIKATNLRVFSTGANVGGILGSIDASGAQALIDDIDIEGEVYSAASTSYTGGIIGYINTNTVFNVNRAIVEMSSQNTLETNASYYLNYSEKYLGGFIGYNGSTSTDVVLSDVFFTGSLITNIARNGIYVGTAIGRDKGSYTLTNAYYSMVEFINKQGNITYTASGLRGVNATLVNSSSMPSLTWWNSFATAFYSANSLWNQDTSGRLYLIR